MKYEIRNASTLALISDKPYTAQTFTAGQTRSYSASFVIPTAQPAGTYRVDTLVFTSDWSKTLLYRNDTTFTAR